MTLQEIIQSLDELSVEEQTSLFCFLRQRLEQIVQETPTQSGLNNGDNFWQGVLKFRETIEQEGLKFTDEDFADLRDRSPGREMSIAANAQELLQAVEIGTAKQGSFEEIKAYLLSDKDE